MLKFQYTSHASTDVVQNTYPYRFLRLTRKQKFATNKSHIVRFSCSFCPLQDAQCLQWQDGQEITEVGAWTLGTSGVLVVVFVVGFAMAGSERIVQQVDGVAHHLHCFRWWMKFAVEPESRDGAQGSWHCVTVNDGVERNAEPEMQVGVHQPSRHEKEPIDEGEFRFDLSFFVSADLERTVHILHVDHRLGRVHSPAEPRVTEAVPGP